MTDLAAGRYPFAEEEWVLDGQPLPPYRRTIKRSDITATFQPASATLYVFAVPVQAGDIFNYVSFAVKTAAATQTHAWVALYNGVTAGAALLAQSADAVAAAWGSATAQKLQLGSQVNADIAQPGTPQGPAGGPGSWAITPAAGPTVVGVAVYCSATTTPIIDGMAGGAVAGEQVVTSQIPISSSASLAATGTAPSVLPAMTAIAGAVPYLLLSRA